MIVEIVGVFLAGLTAGSFIFSGQPPAQTTSSDGKTALAFLLNGTSNTKPETLRKQQAPGSESSDRRKFIL